MKKIILLLFLFSFGAFGQSSSIDDLLDRLESSKNSPVSISTFFNDAELLLLQEHFAENRPSGPSDSQRTGEVCTAFGWESQNGGFGSFDISSPNAYTTISVGSGTPDFEGAGAVSNTNTNQGFVMDSAGRLYEVALDTGVYTQLVTTLPLNATGMAFNPIDDVLYMATITELYTIDTEALTATLVGSLNTTGGTAIALAIDNLGNGYTYDITDDTFYSVDLATGAATAVGPIGFDAAFGQGMAWDALNEQVLMSAFNAGGNLAELRSVDLTTGMTTVIGEIIPEAASQVTWMAVPVTLELNDDPATATTLAVGEVFEDFARTADNTEATASEIADPTITEPSCSSYGGGDLWYTATVPESGKISFETNRADPETITDTGITVYEGEIGSLVEVECDDDDSNDGFFSLISLEERTPGEVLYLRVFEFGGDAVGTFQVSAYDTPPPPNDDPDGAIELTVGSVFADFPEIGTNISATASEVADPSILDPTCSTYGGGDIWYSVAVPSTGQIIVETNRIDGSPITDTGMSIYEGEIGTLIEVECDDDDSEDGFFSLISLVDRTPGEILFIRVFEFGNDSFGDLQTSAYSDCSVNGGTIGVTGSGNTEVNICVGDAIPDPIEVTLGGDSFGTNSGWIITDNASSEILGLPAAPPFDLEGVEPGICAIYYIRFEDGLTGLEVGQTLSDIMGCFDLSNPILVDRVNEGGACVTCEYTLEMNDSFGDGWDGALIDVLVDGIVVLDDVTLESDPDNDGAQGLLSFPVNSTAVISTVFVEPGAFPNEVSYRILSADGIEVAIGDPDTNIEPNTLIADCPTCLAPTDLLVENLTDTSVDLSWTDNNMPASPEYTVEFGPLGFELGTGTIETGITTASLALTGLDVGTEFEFYVTSNCAIDDSSLTVGPIGFTTLAPPGDCFYTLEMNDSFGDGWNGATMDVLRNGALVLNNVSIADDPNASGAQGVLTFEILPGDDITTVFEEPGGFPGEISYRILDANLMEVGTGTPDANIETGTITAECPTCFIPLDLAAGNFTPSSVDLSWTMPMAAFGYNWEIQDVGVAQGEPGAIAIGSTLVDTFDTAIGDFIDGNMYTFYIQAGCTTDDFSEYVSLDFLYFIPPPNDDCENAIEIFCGETVTGATTNAGDSGGNGAGDVFYTYTPEDSAQDVVISLCDGGTDYDSLLRVFDDDCDLISTVALNDDSCGFQSEVSFFAAEGTTYTIMVEGFGANVGNYSLAISCETNLSVEDSEFNNFSFYPNPASSRINLNTQQSIEQVTIFNMLGQQVLNQKIGVANTQLDVSALSAGNYIMQVLIDGKSGTYKILKQ